MLIYTHLSLYLHLATRIIIPLLAIPYTSVTDSSLAVLAAVGDGNEEGVHDSYGSTEFPGISRNGEISGDVELRLFPVVMHGKTVYAPKGSLDATAESLDGGEIAVRRKDGSRTHYWNRPDLDSTTWRGGWYFTGDVGQLDYTSHCSSGPRLKIIDRVNSLEELYWHGDSKWIEAVKLEETVYSCCAEVANVVLTSDRNRSGLLAIVVPVPTFLRNWEARTGQQLPLASAYRMGSAEASSAVPRELQAEILGILQRAGQLRSCKPWEIPVGVVVSLSSWTERDGSLGEEGLLTITGKTKRGSVKRLYLSATNARYGELEIAAAAVTAAAAAQKNTVNECPPALPLENAALATNTVHSAAELVGRAKQLVQVLCAQEQIERFSRQQQDYLSRSDHQTQTQTHKKGSRVCDTTVYMKGKPLLDASGKIVEAWTARARDWLSGDADDFYFDRVCDIDPSGNMLKSDAIVAIPSSCPPTDIDVKVVQDLPIERYHYLCSLGAGEDMAETIQAMSLEPIGWFRQRVAMNASFCMRVNCHPRMVRLIFEGRHLDDDSIPLNVAGIVDGSELTVEIEQEPGVVSSPYYCLPRSAAEQLNQCFGRIRDVGLRIRENEETWMAKYKGDREVAEQAVLAAVATMEEDTMRMLSSYGRTWSQEMAAARLSKHSEWYPNTIGVHISPDDSSHMRHTITAKEILDHDGVIKPTEPPLLTSLRGVLSALICGHRQVLHCTEAVGAVAFPADRDTAFKQLTELVVELRDLGDELDVETRQLPITWTLDLDWVCPPAVRATCRCVMGCGKTVFVDELEAHTNMFTLCDAAIGVVPDDFDDGRQGTTMGGSLAVICDISGAEIDPEDNELLPEPGGDDKTLPTRTARMHSIESGVNRKPIFFDTLCFLHQSLAEAQQASVLGSAAAIELLQNFDEHHDDNWVADKQNVYWLHEYVKRGRNLGKKDTPASMITAAFDAFELRPCLAIPSHHILPDSALPRLSSRLALADAAGLSAKERDGFVWLSYGQVGELATRIAKSFCSLLPPRSTIAISGYNDWEWIIADFAISMAGMVSVGIHGTYENETASACLNKLGVECICVMGDLLTRPARWSVTHVLPLCPQLTHVVAMDISLAESQQRLHVNSSKIQIHSFVEWISTATSTVLASMVLPDPFEARGASWVNAAGQDKDMATVLFTSGSSGTPKAVAVGVDSFVHDISGDKSEQLAVSQSLTISYIPLSHSSDRYKVWQHCVLGGRVAFCYFAASNWNAHEKDKKDSMLSYTSPIDELFRQIQSVQPSSMALPPNIWAGLFQHAVAHHGYPEASDIDTFDEAIAETARSAAAQVALKFGGKVRHLATGGAPTPPHHLHFAESVARAAGASFSNSYGATECGAITADGYQRGSKFKEVHVRLIDRADIGFTHADQPNPRGEVAVSSPSLTLGYFGDAEKDREVFLDIDTEHGPCPAWICPLLHDGRWYLTGDIAEQDVATGRITLIDRKSAVVATQGGAIVRLGEIETKLESIAGVRHALAHASPKWQHVAVVLSVDLAWLEEIGVESSVMALGEVIEDPLVQVGQAKGTIAWRVGVTTVPWTVQNGMLSGELKKKRRALELAYADAVEGLHCRETMHEF